jgi:hypothetical protein
MQMGERLRKEGYRGYFELDFLADVETGEMYLGEMNPRAPSTLVASVNGRLLRAPVGPPQTLVTVPRWSVAQPPADGEPSSHDFAGFDQRRRKRLARMVRMIEMTIIEAMGM